MTEEDKKAAKAKAGNTGNKKGGKGDRSDKSGADKDELVNVDISAKVRRMSDERWMWGSEWWCDLRRRRKWKRRRLRVFSGSGQGPGQD